MVVLMVFIRHKMGGRVPKITAIDNDSNISYMATFLRLKIQVFPLFAAVIAPSAMLLMVVVMMIMIIRVIMLVLVTVFPAVTAVVVITSSRGSIALG